MKRILIAATAAAALGFAPSAFAAASATTSVTMSSKFDPTCTIGVGTISEATNATVTGTAAGGGGTTAITLALADADTAALKNAAFTLTYAGMCNYAHNVSIQSANGGLVNTATTNNPVANSGDFIRRIGYTSTVEWAGGTDLTGPAPTTATTTQAGDTAATAGTGTNAKTKSVTGSNLGDLVLTVNVAASTTPVVAGTYSDTLVLKLGATI